MSVTPAPPCPPCSSLTMREKLERWKKETGRTPMKRLSYVCEYWKNGKTVTPYSKSTSQTTQRRSEATPKAARHSIAAERGKGHSISHRKENAENHTFSIMTRKRPRGDTDHSKDGSYNGRHPSRRSTVKKPRYNPPPAPLTPTNKAHPPSMSTNLVTKQPSSTTTTTTTTTQPNSTTAKGVPPQLNNHEINGSFECGDSPCLHDVNNEDLTQQLNQPHVHFLDQSVMFRSTTICYTDLRRQQRRRMENDNEDSDGVRKSLVWVTPVRRSTRRSRGGGRESIQPSRVFDSPSDFSLHSEEESGCEIVMVPNLALMPMLANTKN